MTPVALLVLLACAPAEPLPTATATPTAAGVRVEASGPVVEVEIRTRAGIPVARRSAPTPSDALEVVTPLPSGEYVARTRVGEATLEVPFSVAPRVPVRVQVQPTPGAGWVEGVGAIGVPVMEGGSAEVLVGVTGGPGMPAEVAFSGGSPIPLEVQNARVVRTVHVTDAPVSVTVGDATFTLSPRPVALATLARTLTIVDAHFPAEPDGSPDLGRPAQRVSLPSPLWERIIRGVGLGGRRGDDAAPWAFWTVALQNDGETPLDLQVSLVIQDAHGAAPAFRPRLRSGDGGTGTVVALLRVPPHADATATLPVFVDPAVSPGAYSGALVVTPLGAATPLHTLSRPLYVTRGDGVASVGFLASLVAFFGGAGLVGTRLRSWLSEAATSELMTIALFGSALFLVGTAADLVALGVGAVLGPFASLFTGLLNDLGRYTLLATLIALLPRPGTLTLAVLTGWFLRGFTTGAFAPIDLLYTGASIGISEAFAWLAGLTRVRGSGVRRSDWRDDGVGVRWARLSFAFAGASVCTTLCGLWMHILLFRLSFAPWYVAMQVLIPGLLYAVIACRIAVDFAASLRRVEA